MATIRLVVVVESARRASRVGVGVWVTVTLASRVVRSREPTGRSRMWKGLDGKSEAKRS